MVGHPRDAHVYVQLRHEWRFNVPCEAERNPSLEYDMSRHVDNLELTDHL